MIVVGKSRKKLKIPIAVDVNTKKILAVGNLGFLTGDQLFVSNKEEMDNAIFEDSLKFHETYYSGYSNYVYFINRDGLKFIMKNRAALKVLELLMEGKIRLEPDGFITLRYAFTHGGRRYFINPRGL